MTQSAPSLHTIAGDARGTWAGLAGELHGDPADTGCGFVLLHGLTFDRQMWQPVLAALPSGHAVLTLDLPGHGASPALSSHRLERVAEAIHAAVQDAGLEAPITVGHSLAAGLAGIYASTYPASAIVNVDSPVWLEPMARSLHALDPRLAGRRLRGSLAAVLREHAQGTPAAGHPAILRAGDEVSAELVLSYWTDMLDRTIEDLMGSLEAQLARVRAGRSPTSAYTASQSNPPSGPG